MRKLVEIQEFVDAPPIASILIESMRDIGYSLETALADVIDNSITAGATDIHIHVESGAEGVRIGIVDNGTGMGKRELIEAMRLGSRHPKRQRSERDLGRFGLGLKTASFSQCRRLTVVSRQNGETATAIWDLDYVATTGTWSLLTPDSATGVPFLQHLGGQGVLVVWEKLDRAVELDSAATGRAHFVKRVDDARNHLELVFHRYLAGESGTSKVSIQINKLPLKPFDPFHSNHSATIRGTTERVPVGLHIVKITPFTLPHHRNVSATEWERYAGREGYLKNQGFYLYRQKRLILHGTWFGLARQMEITKLTRVRIDMPNGLDHEWHVDVKKASARPPLPVREKLQRIIREIGAPSRRIYTHRGTKLYSSHLPIWDRLQDDNAIVYRINQKNPIVQTFMSQLPATATPSFLQLLQALGAGLPLDAIFADLASSPDSVRTETLSDQDLEQLVMTTQSGLRSAGLGNDAIVEMLRTVEPFRSNWERTESVLERIESETADGR